jgi:hypothetical protein
MELEITEGVRHSLQRGDAIIVTLAGPVSTQARMLLLRQLQGLFPAQKVVVLEQGMTFEVYSEHTKEEQQAPALDEPKPRTRR